MLNYMKIRGGSKREDFVLFDDADPVSVKVAQLAIQSIDPKTKRVSVYRERGLCKGGVFEEIGTTWGATFEVHHG